MMFKLFILSLHSNGEESLQQEKLSNNVASLSLLSHGINKESSQISDYMEPTIKHSHIPICGTYVAHVEVMHQQALVVADCHLQQTCALLQPSRVNRQAIIQLGQLLLLDTHGVHIVAHPCAPHAATRGTHAAVRRVTLLLQDHVLRRKVLHDGVGGQPGEAGHRWEMAEHYHARAKIGVHAPIRAQEFVA